MHLLIGKDKEEIKRALDPLLREVKVPLISFYPENFSIKDFLQETETRPFLAPEKAVIVHEIDALSKEDLEKITHYLKKPSPWVTLFLTADELSPQSKLVKAVENGGKLIRFKEEKPWEKEKRLGSWLIEEAKREKKHLSSQAAHALVQGVDHQTLRLELDKLITYCAEKPEITLEDISLLSTPAHHENQWQLMDALFAKTPKQALEIGRILLEEGMNLLMLLALMRTQFMNGMEILSLGREASQKFPYLKGNLLEKKLTSLSKYGKRGLQNGILLIFDTEIKAKNSAVDPNLLLEILIVKLCHDIISAPKPSRASL